MLFPRRSVLLPLDRADNLNTWGFDSPIIKSTAVITSIFRLIATIDSLAAFRTEIVDFVPLIPKV